MRACDINHCLHGFDSWCVAASTEVDMHALLAHLATVCAAELSAGIKTASQSLACVRWLLAAQMSQPPRAIGLG